jgi:steroid delta-isomerase-like uncharacterized protein
MSTPSQALSRHNATTDITAERDRRLSITNKAAARAVFEVWSTGEIDRLDEYVAPDVLHHDPYDPYAADGLAGMKRTIALNRTAFPDMQLVVEDQIAEGDKVVTRWRAEMTHEGKLAGLPATGNHVTITGITVDRFQDGMIVEAWRNMDTLALLRGTGGVARP